MDHKNPLHKPHLGASQTYALTLMHGFDHFLRDPCELGITGFNRFRLLPEQRITEFNYFHVRNSYLLPKIFQAKGFNALPFPVHGLSDISGLSLLAWAGLASCKIK
jgi:hypothetical protein